MKRTVHTFCFPLGTGYKSVLERAHEALRLVTGEYADLVDHRATPEEDRYRFAVYRHDGDGLHVETDDA